MQLTLIIFFCYGLLNVASADDLLELGCITDDQCKEYERGKCRDSHCFCTAPDSKELVACKPKDSKHSNIVGGPCTQEHVCSLENAECDAKTQLCFCSAGYIPSKDRRRCLAQMMPLGGHCELNSQCQATDKSALCHISQKSCLCKDHFEAHNGRCLATLELDCINDSNCTDVNAVCLTQLSKCACTEGFVYNHNMTNCMPSSTYGASCTTTAQCQLTLGFDGICGNNTCSCRSKYYPKSQEMDNTSCEPVVVYGAYCRQDKDCQHWQELKQEHKKELKQEHKKEAKQLSSMVCKWGECACQDYYHVEDNEKCVLNTESAGNELHSLLIQLLIPAQFFWLIYSCI